ncbi:MAG: 2-phospho-L-lactate transferase CofD family protein [Solirubrobacteraceae bacterium]|nr:2-phospho-L-lactate transferase CofD family protein [Patulibacter sp.]
MSTESAASTPDSATPRVVLLSGGTGGAKLARGFLDVVGANLTVIANVADDIDIYGAHVSPDPDLVSYWLAQRVDPRGWGIENDSFTVMDELRKLGEDIWFNLGDRDLAVCVQRAKWFAEGVRPTEALARLTKSLGIAATVLPPTDDQLRTTVQVGGRRTGVQDFLIRGHGNGPIEDVKVENLEESTVTDETFAAIHEADVIVIGPSNPALSITPIIGLPGLRDAIKKASAPKIVVSPLVEGFVLKGPTDAFLDHLGVTHDVAGIASLYADVLDGIVSDDAPLAPLPDGTAHRQVDVLLDTPERRREVAADVLSLAAEIRGAA